MNQNCLPLCFLPAEFKGTPDSLDLAEEFLWRIIKIPHYSIRIDAMLLREEFDHAMTQVDKSLALLLKAINGEYLLKAKVWFLINQKQNDTVCYPTTTVRTPLYLYPFLYFGHLKLFMPAEYVKAIRIQLKTGYVPYILDVKQGESYVHLTIVNSFSS